LAGAARRLLFVAPEGATHKAEEQDESGDQRAFGRRGDRTAVGRQRLLRSRSWSGNEIKMREKTGKELRQSQGDAKQVTRIRSKRDGTGAVSLRAGAIGALAIGALAIGALAIGRLVIRRLGIGKARIRELEIEELEVKRLRVGKLVITDSLVTPSDGNDF
jgi:hypothetical protein